MSFYDMNLMRIADTAGLNIGQQDLAVKDLLPALAEHRDVTVRQLFSHSLNKILLYFTSFVKDVKGVPLGVIVIRMPMERLDEILAIDTSGVTNTKGVGLIDNEGLLIYSNHTPKKVFKHKIHDWEEFKNILSPAKQQEISGLSIQNMAKK